MALSSVSSSEIIGLQTVTYPYNIRGWLKQINNPASLGTDLFGFKINYNTASHGATALYNGNISETEWKTQNDNVLRWYKYGYDKLNRITSGLDNTADTRYSLTFVDYDKNGNIQHLNRRGQTNVGATTFGVMDQLTYTYQTNSNKLTIVSDAGNDTFGFKDDQIGTGTDTTTDYIYDANGNMLKDLNKVMTSNILYNHLNLPTKVTFAAGNIAYIYDATGVKLEKVVTAGTVITRTKYAGNFIYEKTGTAADVLKFFNTPEGYVEPNGSGGYNYFYQYKDHLGNIRLTYADLNSNGTIEASSEILDEKNYYPFGLEHKGYNNIVNGTENNYFNYVGKELNESLDYDMLEMDWRHYDPAIGRFNVIDKLTESFQNQTPYQYSNNNPIVFKDPSGLMREAFASTVVDDDGVVIDYKDDGDTNIYLNSRSGPVVGQEEKGRKYKKGDKIFDVDKSNPDYTLYSLVTESVGVVASATVYNIPQSITVYDDAGKIIGRWITKLKVPFKALKMVGGVLKPVSGGLTFISTASDVIDYSNGEISGTRLGYRTTGTVATIITTSAIGGPPGIAAGVVVGGAFYAGEMVYDGVKASAADTSDPDNNANTIHSIGEFFRNLGWGIENLDRGLGEGIND